MDLLAKVKETIRSEQLLQSGDVVIVAVSGGPDSVALLHVMKELAPEFNSTLIVAHVNHQFRGSESEQEARTVQQIAQQLQLPFELGTINVPEYMQASGLNAQVAAREKRYAFLLQVAARYQAQKIALAHHADDQAETMLMRIIRGTGLSGLTGIPIRRMEQHVQLIRPFLRIYKSEIVAYCDEKKITYCQDSSNVERKYFRNEIRLDILPYLKQWNPQLPQALNRLAEIMKDEDEYLEQETKRLFHERVSEHEGSFSFHRNSFLSIPTALQRRLIKLILSYLSKNDAVYDFQMVENARLSIIDEAHTTLKLDLGNDIALNREYEHIRFGPLHTNDHVQFFYVVDGFPDELHIAETNGRFNFQLMDRFQWEHILQNHDPYQAFFDYDQLALPLMIRNRRPGDRMQIMGLKGTKKVKDIFIDAKIAPSRRARIPIVVNADQQVLWIPGLRISEHSLVTEHTQRILHMKYDEFIC